MKQCINCGNSLDDSALFCNKCGTRLEAPAYEPEEKTVGPFHNAAPQQPAYQAYQAPQQPKKKKKTGLIIGIVAAAVIVLAAIGAIAEKSFQDAGYGSNDVQQSYSYSKGSVEGDRYVNHWADLAFQLGSNWTEATAEEYASYEDSKTDCGLYVTDANTYANVIVSIEKLEGMSSLLSAEDYIEIAIENLTTEYSSIGFTCTAGDITSTTVAGQTYQLTALSFSDLPMVQQVYARKLDNYVIAIMITADSNLTASTLASQFTTAN